MQQVPELNVLIIILVLLVGKVTPMTSHFVNFYEENFYLCIWALMVKLIQHLNVL